MNYNSSGKFGLINNQSSVVIQTQHDTGDMRHRMLINPSDHIVYPGASNTLDESIVRIDRGDIVFKVGTSKASRTLSPDGGIPVTSFLNGYAVSKNKVSKKITDPNDEEQIIQALSESICIIGQAMKGTVPNPSREEDTQTQLTTRVQGTGTVINTGDKNLVPGDTLIADFFRKDEIMSNDFIKRLSRHGFGASKVPIKTMPLSSAATNFESSIKKALGNPTVDNASAVGHFSKGIKMALLYAYYLGTGDTATFDDWLANNMVNACNAIVSSDKLLFDTHVNGIVKSFLYLQEDLKRREIGKVYSYGAPGKGVDVLFGAN